MQYSPESACEDRIHKSVMYDARSSDASDRNQTRAITVREHDEANNAPIHADCWFTVSPHPRITITNTHGSTRRRLALQSCTLSEV
jgi:hypothetical protein